MVISKQSGLSEITIAGRVIHNVKRAATYQLQKIFGKITLHVYTYVESTGLNQCVRKESCY